MGNMASGPNFARDYAHALLAGLNISAAALPECAAEHPAMGWAQSGAMALTGHADGPPLICPVPLAACADGALMVLAHLAGRAVPGIARGATLLGERAAIAGYRRNGGISAGGSCRFVAAGDGWVALNLARDDDCQVLRELVEHWPRRAAEGWRPARTGSLTEARQRLGPGPLRLLFDRVAGVS